ncbi:hypothetical protein Pelo_16084 [Pelomyxa schiedti]|nr:hypothetical protein Pelo_16084 [Pelomyxa schiedti]
MRANHPLSQLQVTTGQSRSKWPHKFPRILDSKPLDQPLGRPAPAPPSNEFPSTLLNPTAETSMLVSVLSEAGPVPTDEPLSLLQVPTHTQPPKHTHELLVFPPPPPNAILHRRARASSLAQSISFGHLLVFSRCSIPPPRRDEPVHARGAPCLRRRAQGHVPFVRQGHEGPAHEAPQGEQRLADHAQGHSVLYRQFAAAPTQLGHEPWTHSTASCAIEFPEVVRLLRVAQG